MIYYNDNDPKACAWLRELIAAGELPPGDVDERSITEIKADDLAKYDQCHFFAGIGGWPLALRWAGLEGVPGIWTGSCPCQPFSCAGRGMGTADERHLWPVFANLIRACRPAVVFGEQVASAAVVGHVGTRPAKAAGTVWLDGVRADMEAAGYAFGASVLGAHSVGAPHIRQRVYWVADSQGERCGETWECSDRSAQWAGEFRGSCRPPDSSLQRAGRSVSPEQGGNWKDDGLFGPNGATGRPPDSIQRGLGGRNLRGLGAGGQQVQEPQDWTHPANESGNGHADAVRPPDAERLTGESRRVADMPGERAEAAGVGAHAESGRLGAVGGTPIPPCRGQRADGGAPGQPGHAAELQQADGTSDVHNAGSQGRDGGQLRKRSDERTAGAGVPWSEYRIHRYLDGKDRRIPSEPRLFPLADAGHPWHRGRVGLLRGAGNAIVPALAAEFIGAWMECAEAREG